MLRHLLLLATLMAPLAAPCRARESADSADSSQQFDAIAARYHRLLARRPQRGTAFDLLYRHYLDAGRLDALVTYYEELTQRKPDQPAAHLLLGMLHARRSQSVEALAELSKAAELARDDFRAPYYQGLLLSQLHRYPEAITALQTALENKPTRSELLGIYKKLGQLQRRIGQNDEALKTWSTLAEKFSTDPFVVEELAELLANEEQFDEAIRRYRQLITLCKDDTYRPLMAQVEIGQIQVRQGKLKTAVATFESCLGSVNPGSWLAEEIERKIESIFLRRHDLSGLTDYYRGRLQQRPDDLDLMVRLAAATSRLGNTAAALEQYRAAVKLAPSRTDLREQLIAELERANQMADARGELEKLVAEHPRDVNYLQRLGQLYLQETSGTTDSTAAETKALSVWRRSAAVRPADPLLAVQAAELCRKAAGIGTRLAVTGKATDFADQGNTTLGHAALEFYQEAVRRGPDVPQYHEYLGEYLHAIGRTEQALAAWQRIAAPPHDTAEHLRRLAEVLETAGQIDSAVTAVDQALKKAPNRYDLHAMAADLRVRQEEYEAALEQIAIMQRLADTPYLVEQTLTRQVAVHAAAGRLPQVATKLVTQLQAADAQFTDFWLAAMIASAERRPTTALGYLRQALERKPDDPRLLRFMAKLHQQGGDLAGAARQYRRLADLEPKNRSSHLRELVRLELELGQHEAAKNAAEELVQFAPQNAENVQLLADVLLHNGQPDAALDVLRRAVRSDPRNRDIRIALAYQLAKQDHVDEALEHYWQVFQLADTLEDKLSVAGALAEHDTNALRQLAWVLLAEAQRGPSEELQHVLEQWIERSPDEAEPRFLQFVMPLWGSGAMAAVDNRQATLAKMKQQYAWLKQHDPDVCTFLASTYLETLLRSGALDEARNLASDVIDQAKDPAALSGLSRTLARIGDGELVANLLTRLRVLQQQSAGTSQPSLSTANVLQQFLQVQVASQNADWEQVLTLFDQYLTATHPRIIRASGTSGTSGTQMSLAGSSSYQTTRATGSRSSRPREFPCPTAYLDTSRLQLLEATYRGLKAAGKRDALRKLLEQRIEQSEGTIRQSWQLAHVFLCWWEGDRPKAIATLGTLVEATPGNVALRILQAHALAATGDVPQALAAIDGVHVFWHWPLQRRPPIAATPRDSRRRSLPSWRTSRTPPRRTSCSTRSAPVASAIHNSASRLRRPTSNERSMPKESPCSAPCGKVRPSY